MGSNNTSNQPPEKSSEGVSGTPSPVLSQHDDTVYQICTCGQRGSGKTSLIRRWARGKWEPTSESTTDIDFIHSSLLIDGKQVGLQVWDCPGDRNEIPGSYYQGALAVIGIFDVTDEDSFKSLHKWFDDASMYAGKDVIKVLIGTYKRDLPSKLTIQKVTRSIWRNVWLPKPTWSRSRRIRG
eukprot:TRINITY_DN13685_c0_g3_i1.p1 TRINITY_DN13685_c0_g3~~TRINITY_DN13685_c0_g3_i1.p1  ORF type:complete len:182 (-),score=24.35 TRINITY_DN13685_c0_g3_i1:408-953(-)